LRCFKRIGDLVTARSALFRFMQPDWSYLQADEHRDNHERLLSGHHRRSPNLKLHRMWMLCVRLSGGTQKQTFFGARRALRHQYMRRKKIRLQRSDLLALAAAADGEALCQRALACSRVCPTAVYPAKHIAELRNQRKRMGKVN
jgi:succinate dehydrogenase/fumarate reductase-like Fe-S protein